MKIAIDGNRVVFGRVGWMRRYAGIAPGDERVIGGGKWNDTEVGSEVCNFKPHGKRVYGYFETVITQNTPELGVPVRLERIDPAAEDADSLDGVMVIFVARDPDGDGQVIVGWYNNATVLREAVMRPAPDNEYRYRCSTVLRDAVLLPLSKRQFPVPTGAGGIGQANVCYTLDAHGDPKGLRWMEEAFDYVNSYSGPNLLGRAVDEAEVAENAERELRRAAGQWVAADPKARKALEEYGVKKAMAYFRAEGFDVENVGARESFDVCCTKNGKKLCVEVKATTTGGEQVILTPNEANLAGERALFVVHSIEVKKGRPSGGKVRVIRPWAVQRKHLKPISYLYTLPPES